ncbi:hypothetical protein HHI36_021665 [Cryptolaemus montrouzieri]|uniref:Uncharacterized protein n=1 Tax=Cryptolaemus montrouzieri TaxID=559131 RepID=A0ABD2MYF0_9CUCU
MDHNSWERSSSTMAIFNVYLNITACNLTFVNSSMLYNILTTVIVTIYNKLEGLATYIHTSGAVHGRNIETNSTTSSDAYLEIHYILEHNLLSKMNHQESSRLMNHK